MNKQAWMNLYRAARIPDRCRSLSEEDHNGDSKVIDAGTAYYATDRYHRSLARRIVEARWDRYTLSVYIMKHAIKRARIRGIQPIEVYWDIQPMRFDPRRLP